MSNYNNSSLANDNNLPPLPEIPMPESSNVRLYESGEFDFLTNLNEAGSITRNWLISYERLKDSNPDAPTYQLFISSGAGTVAETLARISTSVSYEIGLGRLFKTIKVAVGGKFGFSLENYYGAIGSDDTIYRYINKTGVDANNLFSDSTIGFFRNLTGSPESSQSSNTKTVKEITSIESTNSSNQTTSITATKTTDPSSNKSTVSISSSDYSKSELTHSSKSLFQSEGKALAGSDVTIEGSDGTINATLLNEMLFAEVDKLLLDDTTLKNPILKIDRLNNAANADNLYLVDDGDVVLEDGSISTLSKLVTSIEFAFDTTSNFIASRAQQAYEIALKQITSNSLVDSLIGGVIADLILGEGDANEIARHLAEGQLKSLATAILDDSFKDLLKSFGMSDSAISDLLGSPAAGYIVTGDGIKLAVDAVSNVLPINTKSSMAPFFSTKMDKLVANDNLENILKFPQIKMMNHH